MIRMKMKVLHAPFEIAGNMARITKHLRKAGVDATSVNYYNTWFDYKCDMNLGINELPEREARNEVERFTKEAMDKYDIFHFHFAHSLKPDMSDLEELKKRGKKILFSFWGSDQRGFEWIMYSQAKFLGYDPPKPYLWPLALYAKHKVINAYADVIFAHYAVPRGLTPKGIIDTSEWTLEKKEEYASRVKLKKNPNTTYFVHAPSDRFKKGTPLIESLFNKCKDKGLPIELLMVERQTPDQAKEIYSQADFALEQVGPGTFGLFGAEMMCWGIPVLVYHTPLLDRIRNYPPVIRMTGDSFEEEIRECIEMKMKGSNMEAMKEGVRTWAIENLDISLGIEMYKDIYTRLMNGETIKQYPNPVWYREELRLLKGVKSDFYKYMFDNGIFAKLGLVINDADYDRRCYN